MPTDNTIPNEEAELLLHKFVTERVPILAFFVSSDNSVRVSLRGFVTTSSRKAGLKVASEWQDNPEAPPPSSSMQISGMEGSLCQYFDECEIPAETLAQGLGSNLQLNMPNGNTLYIAEVKEGKSGQ